MTRWADVVSEFRKSYQYLGWRPRTKSLFEYGIRLVKDWSDEDIENINRAKIFSFIDRERDSSGRCHNGLSAIKCVIAYAYDRGIIKDNPATNFHGLPKHIPIPRWSEADVEKFIAFAKPYLARVIIVALYTGQRRGDLIRMQWKDYDGEYIMVRQEKTGKKLIIPVHGKLRDELETVNEKRPHNPYILWNSQGDPWHGAALHKAIKKELMRLGMDGLTLHGIRKTTASKLAEIGCSYSEIAAITGHSFQQVESYTKEADQRKLAGRVVEAWANS